MKYYIKASGGYEKWALKKIKISTIKNLENDEECDLVICKDKSNNPVKVKYVSRFLHFLILGPTGSGKTSKILIPIIWQDIQNRNCAVIVIEPKGDLVEKVHAMGKKINRDVIYFEPTEPDCPYYNPLDGREELVVENMIKVFTMLTPDSKQYFQDITDKCLRNCIMLLKRLEKAYTDEETGISEYPATLLGVDALLQNANNSGRALVIKFSKIPAKPSEKKQNQDIVSWFTEEYYNERSKIHEHASGIRNQVSKLVSNKYLRRILNPPNGKSDINFDEIMKNSGCIAITTSQGLLDELGKYLGYFIILNLQSSIFRRPGSEWTRNPVFLVIDEFQEYSTPGFGRILTQGRSYRVSATLATQGLSQMAMGGGRDGEKFVELVLANARNQIIFPGLNDKDSSYFERIFGTEERITDIESDSEQKFNIMYGFKSMNYPTHSVQHKKEEKSRYTATQLRELSEDEIGYRIIDGMKVMKPEIGIVSYIDRELNEELNYLVNKHKKKQEEKMMEMERRDLEEDRKFNIINQRKLRTKETKNVDSTDKKNTTEDNYDDEDDMT